VNFPKSHRIGTEPRDGHRARRELVQLHHLLGARQPACFDRVSDCRLQSSVKGVGRVVCKRIVGAGVALLAAMVVASVVVWPATAAAPAGGKIALFATVGTNPVGKIVVAGAIGDWGTVRSVDANGKADPNGNLVDVHLQKGSFEIDATALNKKLANPRPQIASDVTCSVFASGRDTVTLLNGSGLYKGISGNVKVTMTFTGVGHRYQSGSMKGQCAHDSNGPPLAMLGSVIGHGTVSFAP
jgi:hypothetical protein